MVYINSNTSAQASPRRFGLQDISDCATADEVIEKLGIGNYSEVPLAGFPTHKGIRDDLGNGIAVVGKGYHLAQPADVIRRVEPIAENLGATFDKFGYLDEGRRFFLRCKMPDSLDILTSRGKDVQEARFSTLGGVDASTREIHSLDVWRKICENGMMGWARDVIAGVKHTKNFDKRIFEALGQAHGLAGAFTALQSKMQDWANTDVTENQAEEIINRIFSPAKGKDVSTRLRNTRESVLREFGNERRGAYGSNLYDLSNAITAWNTHERTRKDGSETGGTSLGENRLLGLQDSEGLLESMSRESQLVLS